MKVSQRFIVCDVESGGFSYEKNPLTEIAFVILDGISLEEIDSYSSYIKPYDEKQFMTKDAIQLTGITPQMCEEEGKPLSLVLEEINEKFKKHKVSYYLPVFVFHNGNFDLGYIEDVYDREFGVKSGKNGKNKLFDFVSDVAYDTMVMARQFFINDELPNFKLNTIGEYLGFLNQNAHEALADVRVTADIFRYFIMRMRNGDIDPSRVGGNKQKFNFQF